MSKVAKKPVESKKSASAGGNRTSEARRLLRLDLSDTRTHRGSVPLAGDCSTIENELAHVLTRKVEVLAVLLDRLGISTLPAETKVAS